MNRIGIHFSMSQRASLGLALDLHRAERRIRDTELALQSILNGQESLRQVVLQVQRVCEEIYACIADQDTETSSQRSCAEVSGAED